MRVLLCLVGIFPVVGSVQNCFLEENKNYTGSIKKITLIENTPKGTIIFNVSESEIILDVPKEFPFSPFIEAKGLPFPPFIEAKGGAVFTNSTIDLDGNQNWCIVYWWEFTVRCANDTSQEIIVQFDVSPTDDKDPRFNLSTYLSVNLTEMEPVGTVVFDLNTIRNNVYDDDCRSNVPQVSTTFGLESPASSFSISGDRSKIQLQRLLDFDKGDKAFILNISITTQQSGSNPGRKGFTLLNVRVIDVDDMNPAFTSGHFDLFVQEEDLTSVGVWITTIPKIEAHDQDFDINETVEFFLSNTSFANITEFNRTNGDVKLKTTFDREQNDVIEIPIKVQQVDNALMSALATLTVHVTDINDNRPLFQPNIYGPVSIAEHSLQNTFVTVVRAIDRDMGDNANFTYTLAGEIMFSIRTELVGGALLGVIMVANSSLLDREIHQQYKITVSTTEVIPPVGNACIEFCNATVLVTLIDINDHSPEFANTSYSLFVNNNTVGAIIFNVTTTDADADENAEIEYSLTSSTPSGTSCDHFKIDNSTGEIILTSAITQANTVCSALIQACDKPVERTQRRCTSQYITIRLSDDAVLNMTSYTASIYENLPERTIVLQMENNANSFSYNDGKFELANGLLTTSLALDREEQEVYHLFIQTHNMNNTNITVTVNVLDANDNAPEFSRSLPPVELHNDMSQGYVIARVNATDRDESDNAKVSYRFQHSIDSTYFHINETSGEITLNTHPDVDQDALYLVIIAYDGGTPSLTNTTTLEVQLPGRNRTISLYVAVPYDTVKADKENIERELSAIFGVQITIESIHSASSSSDSRSVLRISGRTATSESVTKTKLQALADNNFGQIQLVFDRYGQKASPPLENKNLSIALIVVIAVLFVALTIAFIIIIKKKKSFNRQNQLLLSLKRKPTLYENPDIAIEEGVSILDTMEADQVCDELGATNPAFIDDSSSIDSTSDNYLNTTNVTETDLLPNEGPTKLDSERMEENLADTDNGILRDRENMADADSDVLGDKKNMADADSDVPGDRKMMADTDSGITSDRENGARDFDSDSDSNDAKVPTGNDSKYLAAVLMSSNSTSPDGSTPVDKVNIEKTLPPEDYLAEETQLPEPPVDFLEEQEISLAMRDDDDTFGNAHSLLGNVEDNEFQDTLIKLSPLAMFAWPPTPPMKHKPKTKEEEEEEAAMPEEPLPDYGKKVRFNFKIIKYHHPDDETNETVQNNVNSFSVSESSEGKDNSVSDAVDGMDAEPEPYLSLKEEITSL